ncbi:MAG: ABC transporter permease [Planctomycetota bacterium]|jgi:ribose/xylose/arabinose/galactoside ABC-type transport system permease subunit|nr:ABC transporter permease [Planctomycetota bacterium]
MKNRNIVIWLLDYGIVAILLALVIFFSTQSSNFLKLSTMMTILKQVSIIGVISVGMGFVILTAGIDLSVGSVACVTGVTAAMIMKSGASIPTACVAAVLLATLYGCLSGLLVTFLSMSPLIATLGMMTSLRGAAFIITGGLPVFGFNPTFGLFANGTVGGVVPYPVILMLLVFAVGIFVLEYTAFGRYIYGVGGNEEASRLSGVNVRHIKIMAYTISGFLSGIAGLVLLSRTNSGQPSSGTGYEMDAITAVVLGGIGLSGGEGKLPLVVVGVLIMGVLATGMLMCNINDYVQQLVKGLVLIVAVGFSNLSSKARIRILTKSQV